MGLKKQRIEFDVYIHELHDVDVKTIENFIADQKYVADVKGGLANSGWDA